MNNPDINSLSNEAQADSLHITVQNRNLFKSASALTENFVAGVKTIYKGIFSKTEKCAVDRNEVTYYIRPSLSPSNTPCLNNYESSKRNNDEELLNSRKRQCFHKTLDSSKTADGKSLFQDHGSCFLGQDCNQEKGCSFKETVDKGLRFDCSPFLLQYYLNDIKKYRKLDCNGRTKDINPSSINVCNTNLLHSNCAYQPQPLKQENERIEHTSNQFKHRNDVQERNTLSGNTMKCIDCISLIQNRTLQSSQPAENPNQCNSSPILFGAKTIDGTDNRIQTSSEVLVGDNRLSECLSLGRSEDADCDVNSQMFGKKFTSMITSDGISGLSDISPSTQLGIRNTSECLETGQSFTACSEITESVIQKIHNDISLSKIAKSKHSNDQKIQSQKSLFIISNELSKKINPEKPFQNPDCHSSLIYEGLCRVSRDIELLLRSIENSPTVKSSHPEMQNGFTQIVGLQNGKSSLVNISSAKEINSIKESSDSTPFVSNYFSKALNNSSKIVLANLDKSNQENQENSHMVLAINCEPKKTPIGMEKIPNGFAPTETKNSPENVAINVPVNDYYQPISSGTESNEPSNLQSTKCNTTGVNANQMQQKIGCKHKQNPIELVATNKRIRTLELMKEKIISETFLGDTVDASGQIKKPLILSRPMRTPFDKFRSRHSSDTDDKTCCRRSTKISETNEDYDPILHRTVDMCVSSKVCASTTSTKTYPEKSTSDLYEISDVKRVFELANQRCWSAPPFSSKQYLQSIVPKQDECTQTDDTEHEAIEGTNTKFLSAPVLPYAVEFSGATSSKSSDNLQYVADDKALNSEHIKYPLRSLAQFSTLMMDKLHEPESMIVDEIKKEPEVAINGNDNEAKSERRSLQRTAKTKASCQIKEQL